MKQLNVYGNTDIGSCRTMNQDIYHIRQLPEGACMALVCDGMGGENGGQIASAIAGQIIGEYVGNHYQPGMTDAQCRDLVLAAVSAANLAVYEKAMAETEYRGMGTTSILALVQGEKAYLAHVGDSRIYVLRDGELVQVTTDHSMVQTLVDRGEITPEEAAVHPRKNMITRAVGVGSTVDIDYLEISNMSHTSLLLCSDGLSNYCTDEEMRDILMNTPPSVVCDQLIDIANAAGGMDNITVVLMTNEEE